MRLKDRFTRFIEELQDDICGQVEAIDGARFREDHWDREGGGGGRTRVLSDGEVIEKGGVNISSVHGELPEPIRNHFGVDQGWFYATGLSLVLHPRSPMIPTVHANYRFFELYDDSEMKRVSDRWFGGGCDLTPYYLREEDAVHFHRVCKEVCDRHGEAFYTRFKKACDDYFYNSHRREARGIGGLFFDYLRGNEKVSDENWCDFVTDAGRSFTEAYLPILRRRLEEPYGEQEREWQEIRRGRYVEFNLIHDRGTLFGLKTDGRVESILMSLPPRVRWVYDHHPEEGSREEALLSVLREPVDWIAFEETS